jgi:hypothetical protein
MSTEKHDRANQLLRKEHVEGIAADERRWLAEHLAICAPCSEDSRAIANSINSLRGFGVNAPAGVVQRARLAVHQRAEQRLRERESMTFLGMAIAASVLWAIVVTPYAWTTVAGIGESFRLPSAALVAGFLMWWFLPGTVLAAAAAWRQAARKNAENGSDWITGENGRQS